MCYAESSLGAPTVQQALSVALPLVCANCGTNMQPQALSDHVWSFGIKCWQISSGVQHAVVILLPSGLNLSCLLPDVEPQLLPVAVRAVATLCQMRFAQMWCCMPSLV
ncbi:TPA: hypothetical protein ACH3X2_008975 [Trebouxia sp. C0005]